MSDLDKLKKHLAAVAESQPDKADEIEQVKQKIEAHEAEAVAS